MYNNYQIGSLKLSSGNHTCSDKEVALHLLETHFLGCEQIDARNETSYPDYTPTDVDRLRASEIGDENKIKWAIDGFGAFRAAGEDGIFPILSSLI
jgi:hypothetical protein